MSHQNLSAAEALEKLKEGNQRYLTAAANPGDVSPAIRQYTCENGQSPYAVVITCSDSRVISESIFSAGIGELFTIRVAGNVMDNHQMGSVEYAADHLGTKLAVVLGHTNCGAVGAAVAGGSVSGGSVAAGCRTQPQSKSARISKSGKSFFMALPPVFQIVLRR